MKQKALLACKKGFTLIELLIVIVVVGLIVGVLFGIGGNVFQDSAVKTAAIKTADDMRAMDEAAQKYLADKATKATELTGAATALVDAGYLKTMPAAATSVTGYTWDKTTYTSTWGTVAADTVITATTESADICSKVNAMYAGEDEGATPPSAVNKKSDGTDKIKDLQCFGSGPYTVVKPVYTN